MTASVFIDGEAGTTGLGIRERLAHVKGIEIKSIDADKRKDPKGRQALMAEVDAVILCLPDDAAIEAVKLADELGANAPRILDASTAHRVAHGWVYGFAELHPTQRDMIEGAHRVSNPGCYPTGAIALIRPLVDAGFILPTYPVTVNAVSGYSGGGKSMIEAYEARQAPDFELYALGLEHKHLPEIVTYSKLDRRPIFVPSVADFRQGMLVSIPLHLDDLPHRPKANDLQAVVGARDNKSVHPRIGNHLAKGSLAGAKPQSLLESGLEVVRLVGNAATASWRVGNENVLDNRREIVCNRVKQLEDLR
mgnify:CR=1 FL=1